MKNYTLEVCVDSVESALAAIEGGADRLELCANLLIGGTTPSQWLYQEIRKYTDIPVHVLVRPRYGDFCYSEHEFQIIKNEVKMFNELGAEGAVIGILRPDGSLNIEQMEVLMDEARGMRVTLHRAFDVCADPREALEQAVSLGCKSILTSGQRGSCVQGTKLLKELVGQSNGRIEILIGSGVNASVISEIYCTTGAAAYHMSGKKTLDSQMIYRKEGVSMGIPAFGEYGIWRTDPEEIRMAKAVLEQL